MSCATLAKVRQIRALTTLPLTTSSSIRYGMTTNAWAQVADDDSQRWSSNINDLPAEASPSSTSAAPARKRNDDGATRSSASSVANLLTLTELRKAAWARIYSSGLSTGDSAISTTRVPTWKQFDTLMIKRHRYIAVDPRDNRTLGWIACFDAFPHISTSYDEDQLDVGSGDDREGRCAEVQVMVAEAERGRGVGTYLVKAVLASIEADRRFGTVQASFFPENKAAQNLFAKCGFKMVGTRKDAVKMLDGPKKGCWRDLLTVELKLSTTPQPTQQRQSPGSIEGTTTIDPNAVLKRPRLH